MKTLKQLIEEYPLNKKKDRKTIINWGWFDWFCSDNELKLRLDNMHPVISEVANILLLETNKYGYYRYDTYHLKHLHKASAH